MKSLYTLFFAILLSFQTNLKAQCGTCTTTWNGSASSINISPGETYCIASGTFTGSIHGIPASSTLCIASGAVFNPSTLEQGGGSILGSLLIYGTASLPSMTIGNGFYLKNFGGKCTFTSNLNINGGVVFTFVNAGGAKMFFTENFNMSGNGSQFINNGIVRMNGQFNPQTGTTFENRGDLRLNNTFNTNTGSTVINNGLVNAAMGFNINSGSTIINNCRFISAEGFNNNGQFTNNGIIWVTGGAGKLIQNNSSATITMGGTNSAIRGADFRNDAIVNGSGKLYFTGSTTHQGSGSFNGTSGTEPLIVYDVSQTGSQIFDIQSAAMSNTVRQVISPAPDTTTFGPCTDPGFIATNAQILPILLRSFSADTRTAEYVFAWQLQNENNDIKAFTLEQSINGFDFYSVAAIAATNSNNYLLKLPLGVSLDAFYRLKIMGKNGEIIYSQILKTGTINKNSISLKSITGQSAIWLVSQQENITTASVRLFNSNGQLLSNKKYMLPAGFHQTLIELPLSAKGVILVQVEAGKSVKSTKLLIQ